MTVKAALTALTLAVIFELQIAQTNALLNCAGYPMACTELQNQRCEDTDGDEVPDTCLCVPPYYLRISSCAELPTGQEGNLVSPCIDDNPCLNGGNCLYNRTINVVSCECPQQFTGQMCENEEDEGCAPGYYLDERIMDCEPCPIGTYKPHTSNDFCNVCPDDTDGHRLITLQKGTIHEAQCIPGPNLDKFTAPYGPIAGGTIVNITIQEVKGFSAANISLIKVADAPCKSYTILSDKVVNGSQRVQCVTAAVSSVRKGPITVTIRGFEFASTKQFEYRDNPVISPIYETKTFLKGGKIIPIRGQHLDSIFTPKMTITVVSHFTESISSLCRVVTPDVMECKAPNLFALTAAIVPAVRAPAPASVPTTSAVPSTSSRSPHTIAARSTTYAQQLPQLGAQLPSGSTPSPGSSIPAREMPIGEEPPVQTPPGEMPVEPTATSQKTSPNLEEVEEVAPQEGRLRRRKRAANFGKLNNKYVHFWLGFELDGVDRYRNVTEIDVYVNPEVNRFHRDNTGKVYYHDYEYYGGKLDLEGSNLDGGADIEDYTIEIGQGFCNITTLVTNAIHCILPPILPKPKPGIGGPKNIPMMVVYVGDLTYNLGYIAYTSDPKQEVILGIVIGSLLALIVIVIVIIVICKKRHQRQKEKNASLTMPMNSIHNGYNIYQEGNPGQARAASRTRNGYLQPVHQNGQNGAPTRLSVSGNSLTPLMIPGEAGGQNGFHGYYMDTPGTPNTPNIAYQIPRHNSIPFEIMDTITDDLRLVIEECRVDSTRLQLKDSIGKGFFGKVYRGIFTDESRKVETIVAIKTIQGKECTVKDVEAFLAEAIVMKDCHNDNVLSLIGVVIAGNRPFAILPYMEHGDLKSYIASPERSIKVRELLGFGVQVSTGMEYLAGQKIVHRDLATRNCMVNKELVVKIADFGLSRDIYKSDYYRVEDKHRPLPVKWMAIESLTAGVFTTSSDVWSFGVLLWELLTRGCPPYPDIDTFNLKSYLQSGRRLPQPEHAPDEVYEIMSSCWMDRQEDRCTFTQLKEKLSKIVEEDDYMTPEYLKLI